MNILLKEEDKIEINYNDLKATVPLNRAVNIYSENTLIFEEIERVIKESGREDLIRIVQNEIRINKAIKKRDFIEKITGKIFNNKNNDYKETLEENLGKIEDIEQRTKIEDIINKYEKSFGSKTKFLAKGGSSTVFEVGNKVFKFGGKRRYDENIPYCQNEYERVDYNSLNSFRCMDKLSLKKIKKNDVEKVYLELRDKGYIFLDNKEDNIGKIKNNGKEELVIIDDVDIIKEEHLKDDNFNSPLEAVDRYGGNVEFEFKYLKSKNLNFNSKDILNLYSGYSNNEEKKANIIRLMAKYDDVMIKNYPKKRSNNVLFNLFKKVNNTHYDNYKTEVTEQDNFLKNLKDLKNDEIRINENNSNEENNRDDKKIEDYLI